MDKPGDYPAVDSRTVLEGQLRECFGRVVYSHKTHEKCADILLNRLSALKITLIALSALTTAGFIAALLGAGAAGAIAGALLSALLLFLNAYMKNFDLGELAQKHRQTGSDLWHVREQYLSLLTDLRAREVSIEFLRSERDKLLDSLHAVYATAPSTTPRAYRKAQVALKYREDMTLKDEEIDAFLPAELHKT
jgi:hypothetical protein